MTIIKIPIKKIINNTPTQYLPYLTPTPNNPPSFPPPRHLSLDDVVEGHLEDEAEPDDVQHLKNAQKAVVDVVNVSHACVLGGLKERVLEDAGVVGCCCVL